MNTIFDFYEAKDQEPLAERMRPEVLEDFIGQEEIIGKDSSLRQMIEKDSIPSMILWGPPGVGKTTLAKIIAKTTKADFRQLSAVASGVKEIKEIVEIAKCNKLEGGKTILFVDEIHRFNKAQQDAFLPYVEKGDIILIGATTENPSFEVNAALLSRCKVYCLKSLSKEAIIKILNRSIQNDQKLKKNKVEISEDCLEMIADISCGDARSALNTLEISTNIAKKVNGKTKITKETIEQALSQKVFLYDKNGEEHYNLISALHKSMRNSDPDAALYYLARMLEAGENPLYIARRLIRFASEDIGIANPNALIQATAAYQAAHYLGMPECNVNLAQAVVYLSVSAKSNSLYQAYEEVKKDALATLDEKVPLDLRNAVTSLDSQMGYGKNYQYAHDFENKITGLQCLPEKLKNKKYYNPSMQGKEKDVKNRLIEIEKIKKELRKK